MFWGALNATAKVDGVIGLVVAALTVLAGRTLEPNPTIEDVLWWLGLAFLLFFALEFLILSPARAWRDVKNAVPTHVTFEAGSIQGGTVIVYPPAPGQMPMFEVHPSLVDNADDDPHDTDTEAGT